mmetsp:Transcript_7891/g.22129  ORF Transcript_7891/g.22129 Transcript_7891/m.22129 type:complete len:209 (+) Transcript_7891:526-1152(+)
MRLAAASSWLPTFSCASAIAEGIATFMTISRALVSGLASRACSRASSSGGRNSGSNAGSVRSVTNQPRAPCVVETRARSSSAARGPQDATFARFRASSATRGARPLCASMASRASASLASTPPAPVSLATLCASSLTRGAMAWSSPRDSVRRESSSTRGTIASSCWETSCIRGSKSSTRPAEARLSSAAATRPSSPISLVAVCASSPT